MSFEVADQNATVTINGLAGHVAALDSSLIALTEYGVFAIVAAVAVRWWWHANGDKLRERYLAIVCGLSVVLGLLLNQAVLLFIHRPRPYDANVTHLLIAPSTDYSFPSDHATLAFAVGFVLLFAGARRGWGFLAVALLMGFSRVYVGIHYASDVLGGSMTALAAAGVCILAIKPSSRFVRFVSQIL